LASITQIVCTVDELTAARSARTILIQGARKVRITIDGDSTEWTQITMRELNDTIAGMQAYQNSVSADVVTAFSINGSKGF